MFHLQISRLYHQFHAFRGLLTFKHFFLRAFLQWQVVTGMEAEQIIESLAKYIRFLRAPNAVCISHLLLIDRRTPVDL